MMIRSPTKFAGITSLSLCLCAIIRGDPLDHWTITQPQLQGAFGANLTSLTYGNGIFVATGSFGADGGWIGYSVDAIHWTSATCGGHSCAPPALPGIIFANRRFLAVGGHRWTSSSRNRAD